MDSTLAQILSKLWETTAALNAALKELEALKEKQQEHKESTHGISE